jgi:hypothetical protein
MADAAASDAETLRLAGPGGEVSDAVVVVVVVVVVGVGVVVSARSATRRRCSSRAQVRERSRRRSSKSWAWAPRGRRGPMVVHPRRRRHPRRQEMRGLMRRRAHRGPRSGGQPLPPSQL